LYTANGKFSRVSTSIKQGQAINLTLDVLDVDNYSSDGGLTFNNQDTDADWVLVVPDAEEMQIQFTTPDNNNTAITYTFPINTLLARCDIQVYQNPTCLFNVIYRHKTHKLYTDYKLLPTDSVGYYTETSFDSNGNLKSSGDRVLYPYSAAEQVGYIQLTISPNAYSILVDKVYKGDKIGVQTVSNFNTIQIYDLKVGRDKWYQFINGTDISLTDDIYINLSSEGAVEGNEFRIHFDCPSLLLNGKSIFIVRDYVSGSTPTAIKEIGQGEVYQMMNQDGGIVFDCLFSDTNLWNVAYQNYDLGAPNQFITLDGVIDDLFDVDGYGKVKGLFGHGICDGRVDGAPDLVKAFIMGAGNNGTVEIPVGSDGGYADPTLLKHVHETVSMTAPEGELDNANKYIAFARPSGGDVAYGLQGTANEPTEGQTTEVGDVALEDAEDRNLPPYWALIYAKKLY